MNLKSELGYRDTRVFFTALLSTLVYDYGHSSSSW